MDNSCHRIGSSETLDIRPVTNYKNSKLKTYGFALAIILGIGGLIVGGVGLAGCLQVGALSSLGQLNMIIMMSAGGGGGMTFLIIGMIGLVKNSSKNSNHRDTHNKSTLDDKSSNISEHTSQSPENQLENSTASISISNGTQAQVLTQQELHLPAPDILKQAPKNLPSLNSVHSGILLSKSNHLTSRAHFLSDKEWKTNPPVISKSEFVPSTMTEHLMRRKKDRALGVKYVQGDEITNMEGALHTFITPICSIHMTGDYAWKNTHAISFFGVGFKRQVIMSAAIQPDFEDNNVMMEVVSLSNEPSIGENLTEIDIPSSDQKKDKGFCAEYDKKLKKHMIYHLVQSHSLPSKKTVTPIEEKAAICLIEEAIMKKDCDYSFLCNQFVLIKNHVISLEIFFNIYVHQLRNEFSALEALLPQGYIYTIDPPKIFVRALNGATLSNRLQILALKYLLNSSILKNLKVIAFNDFEDMRCIELLFHAINSPIPVVSKSTLFQGVNGQYSCAGQSKDWALVLHNNSDGFGQNIETEGMSSMDGVLGCYSDASCTLHRSREDLLNYVF